MRVFLWVIGLCSFITSFAQNLPQQQPNNTDSYNVEVRFRRAYGTIGSDGSSGNNPDPTWQVKTANDTNSAPNSLLNNSKTVGGIDNNAYCFTISTLNNGWHPIENDLLGTYTFNQTGRVDFEVMSYENDSSPVCEYNADPPGTGENVNDDDNMAFLESQINFTAVEKGIFHNLVRDITNGSKVEFRYIWRLANGTRDAPLSFGSVNNCKKYTHSHTIRDQQETYQTDETFYQNDWTPSDHPNFAFNTQMTYIFYNDRDRRILLSQNLSEITAHLIKVDSSFNLLQYIGETRGDLDTTIALGLYAIVMENDESTDTFDLSFRFEDAIHNPPVYSSNIIYVKEDGLVDGDGSSWSQATPFLQAAMHAASPGQQVWVAGGTYWPNTCGSEELYFYLDKNIEVYGGFSGVESDLQERVLGMDTTFLTGEINDPIGFDNSKTVFRIDNTDRTALLNGLTITSAQRSGLHIVGASPTIDNCLFIGNNYSGIFISATPDTSSFPYIVNSTFTDNYSSEIGGGLFIGSGINSNINDAIVTNCIFSDNSANYGGGGVAIAGSVYDSKITITNCTFHDNASNFGSAIFTIDSNNASAGVIATVRNSIFWNKDIFATRMIHGYSNTYINLVNSLIPFDNATDLQGTSAGIITDVNSVYNLNPKFVDSENGDLRIQFSSPAIDMGNTVFNILSEDIGYRNRVNGSAIDLGAYENQLKAYVNKASGVLGTGASWSSPAKELYDVLSESKEIWVAKGVYYPTMGTDRTKTFNIPDSTHLFGGFTGNEPDSYDLNLRDFELNQTILSGNIGDMNDSLDNSYHVVSTSDVSEQTWVNGFTIAYGNSLGVFSAPDYGGAWINRVSEFGNTSSPKLENITFQNNASTYGGGFSNFGSGNFGTTFKNCHFLNNKASQSGGAIYLNPQSAFLSSYNIKKSRFQDNTAVFGAAISASFTGSLLIDSCEFNGNIATSRGGGLYLQGFADTTSLCLTNSIFKVNRGAENGAAIYASTGSGYVGGDITDCQFQNNSNSDIASDLFFDAFTGDIQLQFDRCRFFNDQVADGQIFKSIINSTDYRMLFENCLFHGKRAGAFYKTGFATFDSTYFNHCTFNGFVSNIIENVNSTPTHVDNSIFSNSGAITNRFDAITIHNSVIDTTLLDGINNNVLGDPNFIAPENGLFYLNCGSPAIGLANSSTGSTTDLSGFLRGNSKDTGAYEFRYENINEIFDEGEIVADIVNTSVTLDGTVVAPSYKIVQAEDSISLNPGFLMQPGMGQSSVFKASIGVGCP